MDEDAQSQARPRPVYTVWQMARYALRLGTLGFGGPVALVGYMYRDLVEERHWISEEEYKQGLTLAQLAPGPLAAQLAIYLGFCHYGVLGATLVGAEVSSPPKSDLPEQSLCRTNLLPMLGAYAGDGEASTNTPWSRG